MRTTGNGCTGADFSVRIRRCFRQNNNSDDDNNKRNPSAGVKVRATKGTQSPSF